MATGTQKTIDEIDDIIEMAQAMNAKPDPENVIHDTYRAAKVNTKILGACISNWFKATIEL